MIRDPTRDRDATLGDDPPRRASGLAPGELVGRLLILRKLGEGGMGVVYSAFDPLLDRTVALKLLRDGSGRGDAGAQARLYREAQALAKLSHPNVVAIHDVGRRGGQVWLSMEYVEGATLSRWRADTSAGWRDVLSVMKQACAGVAAAHAAGLLHRDIKPDNIMVGADGRVRVMDFGLARAERDAGAREPSLPSNSELLLSVDITAAGALLGTPAYMAPEQFAGQEADARSDQFSLCATLWEALYGARPFAGRTIMELAANVAEGRLQPAPAGARVPAWLRRVALRGLSIDPARRYPSVDALQEALGADPRRRRWILGGVLGVAVAVAGWGASVELARERVVRSCVDAGARVDAAWSAETRASVREGLESAGVPYGATTAARALQRLDQRAGAWREARVETCMDGRVRGRWRAETLDRATWCLQGQLFEFEALTRELAGADAITAQKAVMAAASLPDASLCRARRRLSATPRPPADHASAQEVRRALSRAGALRLAGHYDEGLEAARAAEETARALGWAPLVAAARYELGALLDRTGRYEQAEEALEDAFFTASEHGAVAVAADAAMALVFLVGYVGARHREGLRWARQEQLMLAALSEGPESLRRARALLGQANVYGAMGDQARAQELNERALAIFERAVDPAHPRLASYINNLAEVRREQGAYDEAQRLQERALEIRERALGPEHPDVAFTLNNLGLVLAARGEYRAASAMLERALEIRERALDPQHALLADSLDNLGAVFADLGELARAEQLHARALTIREAALGPAHPRVATALSNLSEVNTRRGALVKARALRERALGIFDATFGADSVESARTLNALARLRRIEGDAAGARSMHERVLEIQTAQLGAEDPELAFVLTDLAELELATGDVAAARRSAERAVQLRAEAPGAPEQLAASEFALARALWFLPEAAGGDRARARALARRALEATPALSRTQEARAAMRDFLAAASDE